MTVEANIKRVNFLDVTLDLANNCLRTWNQTTTHYMYVRSPIIHPKSWKIYHLTKNHLTMQKNPDKKHYKRAATTMSLNTTQLTTTNKNRRRKRSWFSINVSTIIGKKFFNIIDSKFPPGSPLHAIFNRNTIKLSYSLAQPTSAG